MENEIIDSSLKTSLINLIKKIKNQIGTTLFLFLGEYMIINGISAIAISDLYKEALTNVNEKYSKYTKYDFENKSSKGICQTRNEALREFYSAIKCPFFTEKNKILNLNPNLFLQFLNEIQKNEKNINSENDKIERLQNLLLNLKNDIKNHKEEILVKINENENALKNNNDLDKLKEMNGIVKSIFLNKKNSNISTKNEVLLEIIKDYKTLKENCNSTLKENISKVDSLINIISKNNLEINKNIENFKEKIDSSQKEISNVIFNNINFN